MRRRPDRPRLWPGAAILVAAAVLAVGGDVVGVLAGRTAPVADPTGPLVAVVLVLTWLVAGVPYAFVVGQVGLVVGLDGGPTTTPVTQAVLVALLVVDVASAQRGDDRIRTVLVATVSALALLAILDTVADPLRAGGVILASTALAAYAIHRYERLSLGLVGGME